MSGIWKRLAAMTALSLAALSMSQPALAWPDRPITMIVPWGAGGGTDQTARIIASLLEKDLGQPINVVNRTGGNGLVGHQALVTAAPDGYTIGVVTTELAMLRHQGVTDISFKSITPLALMNNDPAGIQVRADSPYKTVADLVAAAKANPGKLKASGTGSGGIWHLAIAGLLSDQQLKPNAIVWVPSAGAAPALQELVAGTIDVVPCSVPEARSLIDAGKVRSLAVMSKAPNAVFPNVPTLEAAIGSKWSAESWRGVAAPRNIPKDVEDKLVASLNKVFASKEYKEFMAGRGFGVVFAEKADFARYMENKDREMGTVMKAAGVTN